MRKKGKNNFVELKVVTAVLEERFKSHRELMEEKFKNQKKHFEDKFNEVRKQFDKGSERMKDMGEEIEINSKFREKIKVIVATISSIFGAIGGILSYMVFKYWRK